jgi:hypothetical protein
MTQGMGGVWRRPRGAGEGDAGGGDDEEVYCTAARAVLEGEIRDEKREGGGEWRREGFGMSRQESK